MPPRTTGDRSPSVLGSCPDCHGELTTFDVLIAYSDSSGDERMWAACSGCGEVVHPE